MAGVRHSLVEEILHGEREEGQVGVHMSIVEVCVHSMKARAWEPVMAYYVTEVDQRVARTS